MSRRQISNALLVAAGVFAVAVTAAAKAHGAATCSYRASGALPDRGCTPGATNPKVTQRTIHSTICVKGWTKTVRPPLSVSARIKTDRLAAYGQTTSRRLFELDHLIPLELGGAPADVRNLWPEPHVVVNGQGSFSKDRVENHLRALVCAGKLTLRRARSIMRTDWRKGIGL